MVNDIYNTLLGFLKKAIDASSTKERNKFADMFNASLYFMFYHAEEREVWRSEFKAFKEKLIQKEKLEPHEAMFFIILNNELIKAFKADPHVSKSLLTEFTKKCVKENKELMAKLSQNDKAKLNEVQALKLIYYGKETYKDALNRLRAYNIAKEKSAEMHAFTPKQKKPKI